MWEGPEPRSRGRRFYNSGPNGVRHAFCFTKDQYQEPETAGGRGGGGGAPWSWRGSPPVHRSSRLSTFGRGAMMFKGDMLSRTGLNTCWGRPDCFRWQNRPSSRGNCIHQNPCQRSKRYGHYSDHEFFVI